MVTFSDKKKKTLASFYSAKLALAKVDAGIDEVLMTRSAAKLFFRSNRISDLLLDTISPCTQQQMATKPLSQLGRRRKECVHKICVKAVLKRTRSIMNANRSC